MARDAATGTGPGFDASVSRWLAGLEIDAQGSIEVTRLGDGKSNLTFLVEDSGGDRWVLRRPPLGKLLPSAHDVAREFHLLSRLSGTDVPIPRPVALREPDAEIDAPLMLMEYITGLVIDSEDALARLDRAGRHGLGLSLARTLPTIHGVDLEAAGLDGLASKKPYAARQLKRWRRQFEDSKTAEKPLVDELADLLERTAPEQTEVTLVHGDYHLANVIVDAETGTVRGVLDWELATLGDPLADLGGLLAYWPQADDPTPTVPTPFPAAEGFPGREELVEVYAESCGRDVGAVGYWETLGCWKVAIIAEGVLRRRLDEPANGDPAEAAEMADLMLRRAAVAAERAGI